MVLFQNTGHYSEEGLLNPATFRWLGRCRTESPDEPYKPGCLSSDTASHSLVLPDEQLGVRSDKFWWFCKVNTRFLFCFWFSNAVSLSKICPRSLLWHCVSVSSMPHPHPWSGFHFLGYSFSFCTPLLVFAPAVPAPAHLIKRPVYCKACTVQPSSTKHSDLAHSIMQNSSEEKPSGKCRNRFFHDGKKKEPCKVCWGVSGSGRKKLFKKNSLSMVFMIYLILAKRLRASGTHNCLACDTPPS